MVHIEEKTRWIKDGANGPDIDVEEFFAETFSSDNTSVLCGEHTIFATPLTFSIAFGEMKEYLGIEIEGKIRYEDLYVKFTEATKMLSLNQINDLAEKFINDFITEYSGHYLRIWNDTCNQNMFSRKERLAQKYYKLVPILDKWFKNWIENNINVHYKVEAYLIGDKINTLLSYYSFNTRDLCIEECEQLWALIKTIHTSFYNEELIDALSDTLKQLIYFCAPQDYHECDINDKNILHQLYIELCEQLYKDDGYKGLKMFYDYDGYGNTICEVTNEKERDFYWEVTLQK